MSFEQRLREAAKLAKFMRCEGLPLATICREIMLQFNLIVSSDWVVREAAR